MSRTAKVWVKSEAIKSLTKVTDYLRSLDEKEIKVGIFTTLAGIEVELVYLTRLNEVHSRLPANLRRRIRSTIKKAEDVVAAIREWNP